MHGTCCCGFQGFFGVYDGHGGHKAAEFVADNLHTNIFGMLDKCGGDMGKEEAVRTGYLKTDEEFLKQVLLSDSHLPIFQAQFSYLLNSF